MATLESYLNPEDVEQMEKAATNLRDRLLIRVLYRSGCRISEALSLTVDDIDLANCTINIVHLKTWTTLCCSACGTRLGKSHVYCPGCGQRVEKSLAEQKERRRMRRLPLDEGTRNMLREYLERGGPVLKGDKKLVFGINRHRAWQIVKECAERAELPKLVNRETGKLHNVSPHRLRDAFAVHAVKVDDTGDGLRLLQEHLGHQSFNTTARYRKVSGREHRDWYSRLWRQENQQTGSL